MEGSGCALPVDGEDVRIARGRVVREVRFTGPLLRDPRVPVFDRHEVFPVRRFVAFGVDPEDPVHPHIDVAVGLEVTVVQVRPRNVRRDLVRVFLACRDLDAGRRRNAVILPRLRDAVEVDRVRPASVRVVERHFHVVTFGRSEDRARNARVVVVGLPRPDARELDRATH